MILDKLLTLADDVSVSATATGTAVIDCGMDKLTTGLNGMQLAVVAVATKDFVGAGAKISVELKHCATDNGTFTTCAVSAPVAVSDFNDKPIVVPMPYEHLQFLKVGFVVSGTISTAGKVSAYITDAKDLQITYADEDGAVM